MTTPVTLGPVWAKGAAVRSTAIFDMASGRAAPSVVRLTVRNPVNHVSGTSLARSGAFRFVGLPPGPAEVAVHVDGFAPHFGTLTVEPGKLQNVRVGHSLRAAGGVADAQ